MAAVSILSAKKIGKNFIPPQHIPEGKDEYCYRDQQSLWEKSRWRNLRPDEVERLKNNRNTCDNWDEIYVTDRFDTGQIKNNEFYGLVRIGNVRDVVLEHKGLSLSAGISNSVIISCDIGDDVAIHNVKYLSHFIIGNGCILSNIDEMLTMGNAKFGNGIIKDGEPEDARKWIDIMNEDGSRAILPFDGIITADAYLWGKYRDDRVLQQKLVEITQQSFPRQPGYYGILGEQCVIKNTRLLQDVKIGPYCCISGANRLENLTINSSEAEPTKIGEGVELLNGIIGFGVEIIYNCIAIGFVVGNNSTLEYGVRFIHSFLGDNSTVACCEALNNLIFPAHEQHHNNSFLIASLVMGQSNIAAAATIGSNHNSRANDLEVLAGRGFWPGLAASVKHPSRFASFVLLAKSAFPAELDIPLPFALVNNNESKDRLEIMPAFWWLYNMYALARNTWKFGARDKRKNKTQKIEFDSLAPDTVEEMIEACRLLEIWTAKAGLRKKGEALENYNDNDLAEIGQNLLADDPEQVKGLEVLGENMEKSRRKVVILKVYKAYHAYKDMVHYYAVNNILNYLKCNPSSDLSCLNKMFQGERKTQWVNLGGQLIPEQDIDQLRSDIGHGKIENWEEIHKQYDVLWKKYPLEKQMHSYAILCKLLKTNEVTKKQFLAVMDKTVTIQEFIRDQVYITRKKDFENSFRKNTYRNQAEMTSAIGTIEDNSFIKQVRDETLELKKLIDNMKNR